MTSDAPATLPDQGLCPTCGFFVGAMATCPRCGARTGKRLSVRIVRIGSIVCSVIGLILLWTAAYYKDVSTVKIESINELMAGALVKVTGTVNEVKVNEATNSLKLRINDGTGDISINAFNKLKQFTEIWGDTGLPAVGDKIAVSGSVSVSAGFGAAIFLSVPERLKIIERFAPKLIGVGKITDNDEDNIFRIQVTVANYEAASGRRPHKFTLEDNSGTIEMVIFDTQFKKLPPATRELLTEGSGKVEMLIKPKYSDFSKRMEASIFDFSSIKPAGRSPARRPAAPPAEEEPAAPEEEQ